MNNIKPDIGAGVSPNVETVKALPATHRGQLSVMQQDATAEFLWTECGVKIAAATLRKLRCVGGGPPFFKGYGGRVFYEAGPLKIWGDAQRGPLVNSTSELASKS